MPEQVTVTVGWAPKKNIMSSHNPDTEEGAVSDIQSETTEPSMYKVLLHNDDYTTTDFVVDILRVVFQKSLEEATRIMRNVHHRGIGVCGVYTYEVAETKVDTVHTISRENGFPLKCTMERE